jgi:hypothetical protein
MYMHAELRSYVPFGMTPYEALRSATRPRRISCVWMLG